MRAVLASLLLVTGMSCDVPDLDARGRAIVTRMVRADEPLLATRPDRVAEKYARMAESPYAYFRGTFPVYLGDLNDAADPIASSSFTVEAFPFSVGDAHFENFGTLRAEDGTFALEVNDFDAADRYPYLWEVRRLAVAMVLAARASNVEDADARDDVRGAVRSIARATAEGYARAIVRHAAGDAPTRIEDDRDNAILADAFDRSKRDERDRRELQDRTEVKDGRRRLKRGPIDEDDPKNVYVDAEAFVIDAIPALVREARGTMIAPPSVAWLTVKDAVREIGSGVASMPRVRFVVLVEGPSASIDDDAVIELKEVGDSGAPGVVPPGVFADTVAKRITFARETIWSRPDADPLWSTGSFFGLTMQLRGDFDAYKTLRVRRLEEELGTVEALTTVSTILGEKLAAVHAGSGALDPELTARIGSALRGKEADFADEQADVAVAYATRVEEDHARFVRALDLLGPRLGFEPQTSDRPSEDQCAIYGTEAW